MSRWTYYAPLWLGTLLAAALYAALRDQLPAWPLWLTYLAPLVGCPLVGLYAQLVLTGVQGAFAQVLPVPGGRSLRGSYAVVSGGFLLAALALAPIGALLLSERVRVAGVAVATGAGVCLAAALAAYAWGLPAAVRDFSRKRYET
ncbi:MAG: hypothetical protein AB7Q17_04870 [Phycisphaerae bacterium]